MKTLLLLIILPSLAACNGIICDESLVYALRIEAVDSVSSMPIAVEIKTLARDGTFVDSVMYTSAQAQSQRAQVLLAPERAGTYDLQVTATGYRPWARNRVQVTEDECHVRTVHVVALLQR